MSAEVPEQRPSRWRILGHALRALMLFGFVLGVVYARVMTSGEAEIASSTEGLRAGDPREAVIHARRAAGWYAPGAPHVRVAYERLLALGTKAEAKGDREIALLAWRSIRSASIETTWLVAPHAEDRDRADQSIARLESTSPRPLGTRTEPSTTLERTELAALSNATGPSRPWVVVLVLSFCAWTIGGVRVLRGAIGATGHLDFPRARSGLFAMAVGIAAWLLAVWRA